MTLASSPGIVSSVMSGIVARSALPASSTMASRMSLGSSAKVADRSSSRANSGKLTRSEVR
jgi:hypothetical protein